MPLLKKLFKNLMYSFTK